MISPATSQVASGTCMQLTGQKCSIHSASIDVGSNFKMWCTHAALSRLCSDNGRTSGILHLPAINKAFPVIRCSRAAICTCWCIGMGKVHGSMLMHASFFLQTPSTFQHTCTCAEGTHILSTTTFSGKLSCGSHFPPGHLHLSIISGVHHSTQPSIISMHSFHCAFSGPADASE